MRKFIALAALLFAFQPVNVSLAETAAGFLESLQGNYSGRGKAVVLGDQIESIACKIKGDFNKQNSKLLLSGECASTKGKSAVNGDITANENSLKGAFVSPRQGVRVTRSSGTFSGGKMLLTASMMDDKVGKLIKVRQVISKTGDGINAEFFTFDNATNSYKSSGSIKLKRK